MGFLSDIVHDSRRRPVRTPEGAGAYPGMLPFAEPLGRLEGFGGGPSLGGTSERTIDSPGDPDGARPLRDPTVRDRSWDLPEDPAPVDERAPVEAGGGAEGSDGDPTPFLPIKVEARMGHPEGEAREPAEPQTLEEEPDREVPESTEDAVMGRASSVPAAEGAHHPRRRRVGINPRVSARGTEAPTAQPASVMAQEIFEDRPADSPGARAPGYGGAPAQAGGVGHVATDASPALRAESSSSPPAVQGVHSQRRRRAGIEPRASSREPEGPGTPPSALTHQPTTGSAGLRGPASREAAQAARETPREAGVPGTVARPLGLPESPPWLPRGREVSRGKEPPRRETPLDSPPSRGLTAAGRHSAEGSGSGEGEIPLVEAIARPAAPPRPLPALRGGEVGDGPGTRQRPSREPEGPRVHIGQVDVLVQAPPERRTASKPERKPTGFTSRRYLRRL